MSKKQQTKREHADTNAKERWESEGGSVSRTAASPTRRAGPVSTSSTRKRHSRTQDTSRSRSARHSQRTASPAPSPLRLLFAHARPPPGAILDAQRCPCDLHLSRRKADAPSGLVRNAVRIERAPALECFMTARAAPGDVSALPPRLA